jgi:hypothetical protein
MLLPLRYPIERDELGHLKRFLGTSQFASAVIVLGTGVADEIEEILVHFALPASECRSTSFIGANLKSR